MSCRYCGGDRCGSSAGGMGMCEDSSEITETLVQWSTKMSRKCIDFEHWYDDKQDCWPSTYRNRRSNKEWMKIFSAWLENRDWVKENE